MRLETLQQAERQLDIIDQRLAIGDKCKHSLSCCCYFSQQSLKCIIALLQCFDVEMMSKVAFILKILLPLAILQ